jgi:hypothetical protein
MLNTANQLVDPTFLNGAEPPVATGTVYISITMTLIRLNKYKHQDSVKMADNR